MLWESDFIWFLRMGPSSCSIYIPYCKTALIAIWNQELDPLIFYFSISIEKVHLTLITFVSYIFDLYLESYELQAKTIDICIIVFWFYSIWFGPIRRASMQYDYLSQTSEPCAGFWEMNLSLFISVSGSGLVVY